MPAMIQIASTIGLIVSNVMNWSTVVGVVAEDEAVADGTDDHQRPPQQEGLWSASSAFGPLKLASSLAIWYGRTRLRNGTNHAPIAHPLLNRVACHVLRFLYARWNHGMKQAAPATSPSRTIVAAACTQSST